MIELILILILSIIALLLFKPRLDIIVSDTSIIIALYYTTNNIRKAKLWKIYK